MRNQLSVSHVIFDTSTMHSLPRLVIGLSALDISVLHSGTSSAEAFAFGGCAL